MADPGMRQRSFGLENKKMGLKDSATTLQKRAKLKENFNNNNNFTTMVINIGGDVFKTDKETLQRFPNTRLAKLDQACDAYDKDTNSYFFDRNPVLIYNILDYYKTGELYLPHNICPRMIESELSFWQIEYKSLVGCCKTRLEENMDKIVAHEDLIDEVLKIPKNINSADSKQLREYASDCRINIWKFLDDPVSSRAAKVCLEAQGLEVIFLHHQVCIKKKKGGHFSGVQK